MTIGIGLCFCLLPRITNQIGSSLSNDVSHSLAMSTRHKWLGRLFSPNTQPEELAILAKTEVSTILKPRMFLTGNQGRLHPSLLPWVT